MMEGSDGTRMYGTMMHQDDGTMMHHDDDDGMDGASMNFTAACAIAWDRMPDDCEADDPSKMCHGECATRAKAIEDACGQDFFPMPYEHINVGNFAGYRSAFCESECPKLMDALISQCDFEEASDPCHQDCFTAFDAVNGTC